MISLVSTFVPFDTLGMSEPASEQNERPREDRGHSQRRHRRRKRHKETKARSKAAIGAVVALILLVGAGFFIKFGPRAARRLKAVTTQPAQRNGKYVGFGPQTIIIMNRTEQDWGYTTVTVNGDYEAHCPEIPKGTQFEFWYRNLRGPKGTFDAKTEKVEKVKILPEGQQPIEWTPPVQ